MLAARAKRVRPHLDDKILASWNGLMLGALARASVVLGEEKYRAAAEKNLAFIQEKLGATANMGRKNPAGRTLFHRWRDGERDNVQLLEGHAFLLSGVIELYEATLEPKHLDFAIELAGAMLATFFDSENGGFWQSANGAKDLILRVKDDYDGAEPSGNSIATLALLKLGAITGRKDFTDAAEKTLRLFARRLENVPQAMPLMLHALDFSLQEPSGSLSPETRISRIYTNYCAPRIRFISPTRLSWATPAQWTNLRVAASEEWSRWFISAPGIPASRQRATQQSGGNVEGRQLKPNSEAGVCRGWWDRHLACQSLPRSSGKFYLRTVCRTWQAGSLPH